ncbi:MAG: uroporphyrinogen-III C-methyltransferase [Gammaproteobacteria bacterium]|nr:uroporphyrinogen-III C-methyltransferase [Gammaproteobacteria bacterium]
MSETATENKKPEESRTAARRKRQKAHGSHGGFGKLIMSLLIVAVLAAVFWRYGLKSWLDYRARVTGLEAVVQALQESSGREQTELDERLSKLDTRQSHLEDGVNQFLDQNKYVRKDWLLAEAEYLIKLAGHRLLLERDVATAIVALESANHRLAEMGDPGVIKVRKQISKDIQALKKIPQPDISGISLTLSTLVQDIGRLPLRTPDPKDIQQRVDANAPESRKAKNFSDFVDLVWADLKSLVVIREHDEAVQHLLRPEQRFYLTQNLQLKLEQARLALLQNEYQLYQERLQETQKWVKKYFDPEHNSTLALQETIKSLLKQEFQIDLPELSRSYNAVTEYRLDSGSKRTKKKKKAVEKKVDKPEPKSESEPKAKPETDKEPSSGTVNL